MDRAPCMARGWDSGVMTGEAIGDSAEDERPSYAPPPMSPRRGGRQPRSDGEGTRKRVLRTATECILDMGYYRTSSNEIARRAGVTWGALQYQFGTRESLLLEVLNAGWKRLEEQLRSSRIVGDTLEERLESLLDVLAAHYSHPDHLAHIEILLDLSLDPRFSTTAKEASAFHGAELNRLWPSLFEQVLGDMASDLETTRYVFLTTRGYLTGNLIASSIAKMSDDTVQREMLIDGLASAVRHRHELLQGESTGGHQ
jgi:AcrR family transcriptional regulator